MNVRHFFTPNNDPFEIATALEAACNEIRIATAAQKAGLLAATRAYRRVLGMDPRGRGNLSTLITTATLDASHAASYLRAPATLYRPEDGIGVEVVFDSAAAAPIIDNIVAAGLIAPAGHPVEDTATRKAPPLRFEDASAQRIAARVLDDELLEAAYRDATPQRAAEIVGGLDPERYNTRALPELHQQQLAATMTDLVPIPSWDLARTAGVLSPPPNAIRARRLISRVCRG